jgi:hypothetical protein
VTPFDHCCDARFIASGILLSLNLDRSKISVANTSTRLVNGGSFKAPDALLRKSESVAKAARRRIPRRSRSQTNGRGRSRERARCSDGGSGPALPHDPYGECGGSHHPSCWQRPPRAPARMLGMGLSSREYGRFLVSCGASHCFQPIWRKAGHPGGTDVRVPSPSPPHFQVISDPSRQRDALNHS